MQFCFRALSIFCSNSKLEPQCKVIAFDAMAIWLQRIKSMLKQDCSESCVLALESVMTTDVRELLITYTWSHWDDPVDAIQHKVSGVDASIILSLLIARLLICFFRLKAFSNSCWRS